MSRYDTLRGLVAWWTGNGASALLVDSLLTPDVALDSGLETLNQDDIVWTVQNALPWSDVNVLCTIVNGDCGAVFFEGVDGVSRLRHRVAWLVFFHGNRVCRIVSTVAILPRQKCD
jgi:hypothetical protein